MLDRLLDELIDGVGAEQCPPIALDLAAEGDVLRGVARAPRPRREVSAV